MVIEICVGSSCHLKGSHDIIELMQKAIADNNLESDVTLAGSFCTGKCNREGGITKENFKEFFNDKILSKLK